VPTTLIGKNEATLHLVRGGEIVLPKDFEPDANGIRGLNANIGERGLRTQGARAAGEAKEGDYVILGGIPNELQEEAAILGLIQRYPWEAFEKVGFRCVQDAGR